MLPMWQCCQLPDPIANEEAAELETGNWHWQHWWHWQHSLRLRPARPAERIRAGLHYRLAPCRHTASGPPFASFALFRVSRLRAKEGLW